MSVPQNIIAMLEQEQHDRHESKNKIIKELQDQVLAQQATIEQMIKALEYHRDTHCSNITAYKLRDDALALSPSLEALEARDQVRDVNLLKEVSLIFHCRAKAGTKNGVRLDDIHYQASMYAELEVMELASKYKSGKWKPNI